MFEHLKNKEVNILTTNVCNLSCGGCHQMCGYIPKEKLFFIELDELEWMVDNLISAGVPNNRIGIFGGEPTLHPKFKSMMEMLECKNAVFEIYTNGRRFEPYQAQNIRYRVDGKENPNRVFIQTWNAPKDFYKNKADSWYFTELAQKNCHMWKHCCVVVWNKRGYTCEVFATIDLLTGQDHGWPMEDGRDVFHRTYEEIVEQAKHFCYRCGWCMKPKPHQTISSKTKISPTNFDLDVKRNKMELVQIQIPFL